MRGLLASVLLLTVSACAIAFTPGTAEPPPPQKFADGDTSSRAEEQKEETATTAGTPAFGVSLVIGGKPLDAGPFPKPPIPVVLVP